MEALVEYLARGFLLMLTISMPCVLVAAGIGLDPFTKLAKIVTPPEREHIFNTACSLAGSKTFAQPATQIAQTARTAATAAAHHR